MNKGEKSYPKIGAIVNFLDDCEDPNMLELNKLKVTDIDTEKRLIIGVVETNHPYKGQSISLPIDKMK